MKIDIEKCGACKAGLELFVKQDDEWFHVDLFATFEAGAMYVCENSDVIEEYLVKNGDKGTWLPNEELEALFREQELKNEDGR